MNKLDNLILFALTLSYILFDREGYINWFYLFQLIFLAHYFLNVRERKITRWVNTAKPLIITYAIFGFFCFFSIIWSVDKFETFSKSITVIIISINSIILYDYLNKTKNSIKFIFLAIIASSYINFLIAIKIIPDSNIYWDSWRFQGTRDNPNYLSVLQLTSIYCSILVIKLNFFKSKIMIWLINFAVLISSYLIILTASKKGLFFSAGLITYFIYNSLFFKKNVLTKLFGISLSIYVIINWLNITYYFQDFEEISRVILRSEEFFNGSGTSTNERKSFFIIGFDNFFNNPIIGSGISTLKSLLNTYSHSNFIEILSGLGIIGFIIYYRIYTILLQKVFKVKIKSIKIIHLIFVTSLIFLDIAQVTYYYKFSIFTIIFLVFVIENTTLINETNKLK